MNTETFDAGAEASSDAGTSSSETGSFPANYDAAGVTDAGDADPGTDQQADAQADGKPARPPLTAEEYEKRHENINAALRESRSRERAIRAEMEQFRTEMRTSQPEAFERFMIAQDIQQYSNIDWNRWNATEPQAAQAAYRQFQQLQERKDQLETADKDRQQAAGREQAQKQVAALIDTLHEQETALKATKPDYGDAVAYLKGEFIKEANGQGFFGEEAEQMVQRHILQLGHRVNTAGQNLAEFSYNMAVQRGYKARAADISHMVAGEAAAKTISDVGTAAGGGGGSFEEQMAGLNGASAKSFWEKAKKNQFR